MTYSVTLDARQRQALLDRYRKDPDPEVRFRAHILLLLADGHTWSSVATFLFCSSRTIDRWVKRFHQEGVEAVAGHKPGRPFRFGAAWLAVVINLVSTKVPRNFGFLRSRWCCEVVALLMLRCYRLDVSRETIRRWLHKGGMVYRRPRPVLKPKDKQREAKLATLRQLLAELPDDETAVFQDEVDINTNPKIGSMWMFKGRQAKVETPGNNQKRYLAGSLHWRSGQVFMTEGKPRQGRNAALFLAHLDDLRSRLRRYHKIHVIWTTPSATTARRCRSTSGTTATGSRFISCRPTVLTATRSSGSGGTCTRRSRGTINVIPSRSCWTSHSPGWEAGIPSKLKARSTTSLLDTLSLLRGAI